MKYRIVAVERGDLSCDDLTISFLVSVLKHGSLWGSLEDPGVLLFDTREQAEQVIGIVQYFDSELVIEQVKQCECGECTAA